jgi:ribonuclease HI
VHGIKLAKEIGIWRILCFGDSDLVVHQVLGDWDARGRQHGLLLLLRPAALWVLRRL